MTDAQGISEAIATLHDKISYQNAGTSREERMSIISDASRAMSNGSSSPGPTASAIDFLLGLLPSFVRFQVENVGDRLAVYCFVPGKHEVSWAGEGKDLFEALENSIKELIVCGARSGDPQSKPKPVHSAPTHPFDGMQTKRLRIEWVLSDNETFKLSDSAVARISGSSEVYVNSIRQRLLAKKGEGRND